MNREDFANLALTLFALFLIVSGLMQLPVVLQAYVYSTVFLIVALSGIGLGILIWVFSPTLVKSIFRSEATPGQPLDSNSVAIPLLSIVGLYLFLTSVPQLVLVLFETSRPAVPSLNAEPTVQPIFVRNLISTLLRLGLGLFVAIRPGTVLAFVSKLQGAKS